FQPFAQLEVVFDERPRNTEPYGARLARHAVVGDRRQDVELVGHLGQQERLPDLRAQRFGREKGVESAVVDADRARAGPEKDAGGRGLATPGSVILDGGHARRPRAWPASAPRVDDP